MSTVSFEAIPEFDASQSNFAVEYGRAINTQAHPTKREKKILEIINSEPSKRRTRKLERLEGHARAHMGINPNVGAIDWSTVKWPEWLGSLAKLFETIWPLIMLFFGEKDDNVADVPFVLAGSNQATGAAGHTVPKTNSPTK